MADVFTDSKTLSGLKRIGKQIASLPDGSPLRAPLIRIIGKHLDGGYDYWFTKSGNWRQYNKGGIVKGKKKK